jgi:DNA processing protein
MDHEKIYLHAWNAVAYPSAKKFKALRTHYDSYKSAWNNVNAEVLNELFPSKANEILKNIKKQTPENLYEELQKRCCLITIHDPEYPALLREIHDPPEGLYILGTGALQIPALAIVGTRKCTDYGEFHTKKLIAALVPYGLTIVSGFAHGIDSIAHKEAIKKHLPTIAVLGHGFNHFQFTKRKFVSDMLASGGIFLSEYPPDMPGDKFHFPERNRIIAGLARATVVIEAPESSGALITANMAFSENRDVYAIPGNIDQGVSKGCNKLIQEQKATPLLNHADILASYKDISKKNTAPENASNQSSIPHAEKILAILSEKTPLSYYQIQQKTALPIDTLLPSLTLLELHQKIERTSQGYRKRI